MRVSLPNRKTMVTLKLKPRLVLKRRLSRPLSRSKGQKWNVKKKKREKQRKSANSSRRKRKKDRELRWKDSSKRK